MNPEAQAYLDELLKKRIEELTPDEVAFLRARRDYIKKSDLDNLKEAFKESEKAQALEQEAKAKLGQIEQLEPDLNEEPKEESKEKKKK